MKLSLLLASVLVCCTAQATELCSVALLIGQRQLNDFPRQSAMPTERTGEKGKFELIELFCSTQSIVSDTFGYAALINPREGTAYIHQYGGYFGVSHWYGPIPVQPTIAEQCIKAQRAKCSITFVTETK